ncbi:Maf family protein [Desulfobaculum bizertense]|uniref:dTTP/UTP pyrophosphatase n=1 Tax=Desulfobaculum bizertense DSM 18034 TaxID=1121442 RepID=A0A1T4VNE2_9BACT|nr:Maf family protein [Desulfobaculum bizertense]UIJ38127.1 Maf family protein [Desulfobaculum bizertense]SKA66483.1 septum formation protein [Desulfobaculum bizertense DSM 18034]
MDIEPIVVEAGPFQSIQRIILASGSPRRCEMLESIGLDFEIIPAPDECEPEPEDHETPEEFAVRAALAKADAVHKANKDAIVIGCDTIVTLDDEIMGKPSGTTDAMMMLSKLVDNTHHVISGCAVYHPSSPRPECFSVSTEVTMGPQPLEVLFSYIETGEPMDKAGSYAIQGKGGFLIESISGSYNNVVGLPLARLVQCLQTIRAIRPRAMMTR